MVSVALDAYGLIVKGFGIFCRYFYRFQSNFFFKFQTQKGDYEEWKKAIEDINSNESCEKNSNEPIEFFDKKFNDYLSKKW